MLAFLCTASTADAAKRHRDRDADRDGLTNRFEKLRSHTSVRRADTDRDGLKDGFEVRRVRTNPRNKDTDADGTPDGLEVLMGTNPRRKPPKLTRDTTPPETYMMSAPVGTVPSSSADFSFISSEAGSSFQCRLDSGSWGACASPKAYSQLANGGHEFDVRAIDGAGNTDQTPATGDWTVATSLPPADTTPPDTTISSGPSGTVSSASASFGFSSTEAGSSFECRLDGGAWGACTSPKDYLALADGTHTFDVRSTDGAGNTDQTPATRAWTVSTALPPVDSTPPETTITSGPTGTVSSASASFGFSASEIGSSFECRLDSGSWGACTSPKSYSGLADGAHTFSVRATDLFANTDATPATRSWTVATSAAPTANFTWSPQNPQNPPVTVTFTSTGTCPATPCTYQWTHGPPGNEPIGTGQTASWTFQSTGDKTVVLTVTDALGRTAQATRTVTVTAGSPPPPPPPPADADGDGVPDSSDQCPGTPAGTQVDATGCPITSPPPSSGWPDASNTGVPAGKTLTAYSGPSTISTANTVIDGKSMGCISVTAPGVVIKNSKISCSSGYAVYAGDGAFSGTPLTVQDSEVDCKMTGGNGFGEANITVLRVDIQGCENGFDMNQNIWIQDSYIHDLYNQGGAHTDGAQFASGHYESGRLVPGSRNVTFLHNTIYGMGADGSFGTSAIISNKGGDRDVLIQNNLLAGGAVALYCEQGATGTNYRVLDNHFSRRFGPKVGFYGISTDCSDEVQSGNVIHETGEAVRLP